MHPNLIRELRARERCKDYEVKFIQTVAKPRNDSIFDEEITTISNQWRVDFPKALKKEIDSSRKTILSIAHKILTRGEFTFLSPALDSTFTRFFTYNDKLNSNWQCNILKKEKKCDIWFDKDSQNEKEFYENLCWQEDKKNTWMLYSWNRCIHFNP